MMYKKLMVILIFCICFLLPAKPLFSRRRKNFQKKQTNKSSRKSKKRKKEEENPKERKYSRGGEFVAKIFEDVLYLHKNLFIWPNYKVLLGLFPPFIIGRMIDEDLSDHFFDKNCWKNKNQLPDWCHDAAQWGIALPIAALGSLAFFANDPDYRKTGRIFLIGMPFVIFGKDLIKTFRAKACLRPWHEDFCYDGRRKFGGFPSGHMAEAMYMTVLFGVRFGAKFAIPLGILSAFIAGVFVNCNRHYVSQIIAGGAFGTVYALAANSLVNYRLCEDYDINCAVDSNGIKVACRF